MPTKQKSGLYRARVKIGIGPDGKDVYKYISGKTKKELEADRQKAVTRFIAGDLTQDDQLFRTYVDMWVKTYLRRSSIFQIGILHAGFSITEISLQIVKKI